MILYFIFLQLFFFLIVFPNLLYFSQGTLEFFVKIYFPYLFQHFLILLNPSFRYLCLHQSWFQLLWEFHLYHYKKIFHALFRRVSNPFWVKTLLLFITVLFLFMLLLFVVILMKFSSFFTLWSSSSSLLSFFVYGHLATKFSTFLQLSHLKGSLPLYFTYPFFCFFTICASSTSKSHSRGNLRSKMGLIRKIIK